MKTTVFFPICVSLGGLPFTPCLVDSTESGKLSFQCEGKSLVRQLSEEQVSLLEYFYSISVLVIAQNFGFTLTVIPSKIGQLKKINIPNDETDRIKP